MKFSVLKMAIAAVCLHGSITVTPDTSSDYLEDQGNYVQIAGGLTQGWHWGLSSANACGTTGDLSDCFETIGSGYGDYDDGGYYDDGYDYDYDTGADGDGGDFSPENWAATQDAILEQIRKDRIQKCKSDLDAGRGGCISNRTEAINAVASACYITAAGSGGGVALVNPPTGLGVTFIASVACYVASTNGLSNVGSFCDSQISAAKAKCG